MRAIAILAFVAVLPLAPVHAQDAAAIDVSNISVADSIVGPDTVTIKAYLEEVVAAQNRYIDQRFADNKAAVDAALASINLRLLGVNEFRQTLSDQQANFATKDIITSLTARISDEQARDEALATRLTTIESSGSPEAIQNTKDIQTLTARVATIEAQRDTTAGNLNWVLAAGAALAGIVLTWVTIRSRATPPNTTKT